MTIEFDESKFPTKASWRRICQQLSNMDETKAKKIADKYGWNIIDKKESVHKDDVV